MSESDYDSDETTNSPVWEQLYQLLQSPAPPSVAALTRDYPLPISLPHDWVTRNGDHYFALHDNITIRVNGTLLYSGSRITGTTVFTSTQAPHIRMQLRGLIYWLIRRFRRTIYLLAWFLRETLRSSTWRANNITDHF